MEYSLKIYARIGELMQGATSDGRAFMISGFSSSKWYSEASLKEEAPQRALPPKACRALSLFWEITGASLPGKWVDLQSNIAPGKGLSSSSTDILSVLSLVNAYLGKGLSDEELYAIAARVEPTDPCLSQEIVLFHQHCGTIGRPVRLPPMSLLYFDADPDRQVDTESVTRPWTPGLGRYYDWLLQKFLHAVEVRDYEALFDCVTASAEYNQTVVQLPRWDEYLRLAAANHSGLMVAHSGTIAGLLTPPERVPQVRAQLEAIVGTPVFAQTY